MESPLPSTRKCLSELEPKQVDDLVDVIAKILTITKKDSKSLVNKYPEDALAVYVAYAEELTKYGESARKWRLSTMMLLPLEQWTTVAGEGTPGMVKMSQYISLKYLCQTEADKANALKQITNRQALQNALVDGLSEDAYLKYQAIINRERHTGLKDASNGDLSEYSYSYLEDIAVWQIIDAVEMMFFEEYHRQEPQARRKYRLRDTEPTPVHEIGLIAKHAVHCLRGILEEWGVLGNETFISTDCNSSDGIGDIGKKDHLLLKLLCNSVANRVILERARLYQLGLVGAKAGGDMLRALNSKGINAAPSTQNYEYSLDGVRNLLTMWFGPAGVMRDVPGFNIPLQGVLLDAVIAQAKHTHHNYMGTRGRSCEVNSHGTGLNFFLFALAVTACFYGNVKLPFEFFPKKDQISVPKTGSLEQREKLARPENLELFKIIYGQFMYANKDQELLADAIDVYCENSNIRHAYLQDFLFHVFKRQSPDRILRLNRCLMNIVESFESKLPPNYLVCNDRYTRLYLGVKYFYGKKASLNN